MSYVRARVVTGATENASTENASTGGWNTQVRKREERSPILHAFTLSPSHNTKITLPAADEA